MNIEAYVSIFRVYSDMSFYVLGNRDENELCLSMVLDTINNCFNAVFKQVIERRNLIQNMTAVILIIDEVIDNGVVLQLDDSEVLQRIKQKPSKSAAVPATSGADAGSQAPSTASLFSSVFSKARNQLTTSLSL